MTDRRRRTAPADPSREADEPREDNPFAPPPEGQPDRPWQPRRPEGSGDREGGSSQDGGPQDAEDAPSGRDSRWSPQQPGRSGGGFGRPGPQNGDQNDSGGRGGNGRRPPGMRWDPSDPLQRHARYALHAGIWGLFFALFGLIEIALLLGALSIYWGISGLRGRPRGSGGQSGSHSGTRATAGDVAGTGRDARGQQAERPTSPVPVSVTPAQAAKARTTAAISGLVVGGITVAIVAGTFTLELVYSDYYTCRQDALTQSSREKCADLLPEEIRPFLQNRG